MSCPCFADTSRCFVHKLFFGRGSCSLADVAVDRSTFSFSKVISVVVLCSLKFIHANKLFYRYGDTSLLIASGTKCCIGWVLRPNFGLFSKNFRHFLPFSGIFSWKPLIYHILTVALVQLRLNSYSQGKMLFAVFSFFQISQRSLSFRVLLVCYWV